MSKITIVSGGEQTLLIDISGCSSFKEAIEQLSSAFLSANQFWHQQTIDLNFGSLPLTRPQVAQIIALMNGVGAKPNQAFAKSKEAAAAFAELKTQFASLPTNELSDQQKLSEKANEPERINETVEKPVANIEQVILLHESDENSASQLVEAEPANSLPLVDETATELETSQDFVLAAPESVPDTGKKPALYLQQTLRAGQAVSHKGDLIIIGDVNAGAEVMAEGDITIWGSLRGIAHAGIDGNTNAQIRALRLQPIQIRIANFIARSPDRTLMNLPAEESHFTAETAKLVNGKIRILHSTLI